MKFKIFITIFAIFLSLNKCLAFENIVAPLIIDNETEEEIDTVMDKDEMFLPVKYFLNYFEIPYKENHADKSLSFKNYTLKNNTAYKNGLKQPTNLFFIKSGIAGSQNEFFVSDKILSEICDKKITANPHELITFLNVKETQNQEENIGNKEAFLIKKTDDSPKAHSDIILPSKTGKITIDTVKFRENMFSDSYAQIYRDEKNKNISYNDNLQVMIDGKINEGKYKLGLGSNSFESNLLAFSGLIFQYQNHYKNYDYNIGKVDPWEFTPDNQLYLDVIGLQVKNHTDKNFDLKNIEGNVSKNSLVKVHLNDNYIQDINTYGGYYSLQEVIYPDSENIKKITLEECFPNGEKKEFFSKKIEQKDFYPKRDFIFGITGLQDRIFANNGSFYQENTKKLVAGVKFHKQISKKLTYDNFLMADKIMGNSSDNFWNQSIFQGKKYLNYTTMKNQNVLNGVTYMNIFRLKNNENNESELELGGSFSKSQDLITPDRLGYHAKISNYYKFSKDTILKTSIFATSSQYYMAGSSSGIGNYISDKYGAKISLIKDFKKLTLNGHYSQYLSNFADYYACGKINFGEYSLNIKTKFDKLPNLSFRINSRNGENKIGKISSSNCELSVSKRIKNIDFNSGIRMNNYDNNYSSKGYSSYSSKYSDIYSTVEVPLGRKFGILTLGHDIVNTKSSGINNNYNSLNISYSTPQFKGLTLNIGTGIHYAGTNKGNNWDIGISKRLKSGSVVSLTYRYTQMPYYMIDDMYIPGSMRHSISLNFSELYGIGSNHKLNALGTENNGFIQACAFLDINQNGLKDKGEPSIKDIPIKISNNSEILYTDKKGLTHSKPESEGIYKIKIDEDELPTLISIHNKTKPVRYIKIKPQQNTKVEFGLISTVGNVNGTVTVTDEFNNPLKFDDLIVSIFNSEGKEVNYANVNDDGTFAFSGLAPGNYIIELDKQMQEIYNVKPDSKTENYTVNIPPVYKDYVNIDNVNLTYKYEI